MSAQVYATQVTSYFLSAVAAFEAGAAALNIMGGTLVVGDGAGVVPPLSSLIAANSVTHEVWRGQTISAVYVDPNNSAMLDISCLIPAEIGGVEIGPFAVTEFAILDALGNCCVVGTTNFQKTTSAQGQVNDAAWVAGIVYAVPGSVALSPPSAGYATMAQVIAGYNANLPTAITPLTKTDATSSTGWTDRTFGIQLAAKPADPVTDAASALALGATRAASDAEFAAGAAAAASTFKRPYATPAQVLGAVQSQSPCWAGTFGGAANALTATLSPAPAALTPGMTIRGISPAINTGAVTLNVNGLGAVPVTRLGGGAMIGGELGAGARVELLYDGSGFTLISMLPMSFLATPTRIVHVSSTTTLTFQGLETRARIRGNGPGAGGGGSNGAAGAGGGGGAGPYIDAYVTGQASGNTLAFTLGAPGLGGSGTPTAGGNSGTTSITGTGVSISFGSAVGGGPGANTTSTSGGAGAGVTSSGANLYMADAITGGAGYFGTNAGSGGAVYGGAGGLSPRSGGNGGVNQGTAGSAGNMPGAGGNGGSYGGNGGAGAPASFVVEFML